MARFRPYRVATATDLSNVPIREGQFIIVENTQTIYFDKSASERVVVGNGENLVTGWNDEDTVVSNSAYTKAETNALLTNKENSSNKVTSIDENSTDTQYPSAKCVYDKIEEVREEATKAIDFKGQVQTYADLPSTPTEGDLYQVLTADTQHNINAGDFVVWEVVSNVGSWLNLGSFIDVTQLMTKRKDITLTSTNWSQTRYKVLEQNDSITENKLYLTFPSTIEISTTVIFQTIGDPFTGQYDIGQKANVNGYDEIYIKIGSTETTLFKRDHESGVVDTNLTEVTLSSGTAPFDVWLPYNGQYEAEKYIKFKQTSTTEYYYDYTQSEVTLNDQVNLTLDLANQAKMKDGVTESYDGGFFVITSEAPTENVKGTMTVTRTEAL